MRTVGDIHHPRLKITLFYYNGKYTAQFESKTVNIRCTSRESDRIDSAEAFKNIITEKVIQKVESKVIELQKFWDEISVDLDDSLDFDIII